MIKRDLKETIKKYNELKDNPPSNIFSQKWDWINKIIHPIITKQSQIKKFCNLLQTLFGLIMQLSIFSQIIIAIILHACSKVYSLN